MLKNYFTLAWRILLRNKIHSVINITGLAIGISACLVISLIVKYEFSFDNFHPDKSRIYRVYSAFSGDFTAQNRGVATALPSTAKSSLTGIESSTGFFSWRAPVTIETGKEKKEFGDKISIIIAGPEYFEVFKAYEWLAGNPETSLSKPNQVVLTESSAKIFFAGDDVRNAIGKEIHYQDSLILTVSGIVKDFSQHSDLGFKNFISLATIENTWLKNYFHLNDWKSTNSDSQFFVKLQPGKSPADLEAGLKRLAAVYKDNHKDNNWAAAYHLQLLGDLHFNSKLGTFNNGNNSPANLPTLKLLILVAIILLMIAAINFVNLETAQAVKRAKEAGVRKVMGSSRTKLIFNFLFQSTVLTFIAALVALPLAILGIQYFAGFIPGAIQLDLTDPFTTGFIIISAVIVSLLAGLYPALSLSSFQPALALKNQMTSGSGQTRSGFVRKSLIVFQFTFAQAMIIATLVVGWQIGYMMDKDLGFAKDAVIYFNTPWRSPHQKTVTLKNEIERFPEVAVVSLCSDAPASSNNNNNIWKYNNGKEELHHIVYRKFGDTTFVRAFNLKLLAGRNIHRSDSADEYLINETYSKLLGFSKPQDAIDKLLIEDGGNKHYPIVGVVKDFNFRPLTVAVEPAIIADEEYRFQIIAIKINTAGGGAAIKSLEAKLGQAYKKVYPDEKLEYAFLDESIAKFYENERRTAKLVNTATGVAILISCLGLFGLATYTTTQRTKEIGIRKVLGATVDSIMVLLSKEFVVLVVIAFAIAAPASWYFANDWLNKFAYKTDVGWQLYFWTILSSVLIVILSVSYQAFKAAVSDPVKSLRYE